MIRKVIIVLLGLAAVGTGSLWAVSHVAPQHSGRVSNTLAQRCDLRGGWLMLVRERNRQAAVSWDHRLWRQFSLRGFFYLGRYPSKSGYRRLDLTINLLWPSILLAAYPTVVFVRGPLRCWRRRRRGLCLKCGYDLTGNTTGVCPECGLDLNRPVARCR